MERYKNTTSLPQVMDELVVEPGPQRLTESLKIRKWTKQQLDKRFGPHQKTYDRIITNLLMDEERWQRATGKNKPQDVKKIQEV